MLGDQLTPSRGPVILKFYDTRKDAPVSMNSQTPSRRGYGAKGPQISGPGLKFLWKPT
jgi:hypothetical protein